MVRFSSLLHVNATMSSMAQLVEKLRSSVMNMRSKWLGLQGMRAGVWARVWDVRVWVHEAQQLAGVLRSWGGCGRQGYRVQLVGEGYCGSPSTPGRTRTAHPTTSRRGPALPQGGSAPSPPHTVAPPHPRRAPLPAELSARLDEEVEPDQQQHGAAVGYDEHHQGRHVHTPAALHDRVAQQQAAIEAPPAAARWELGGAGWGRWEKSGSAGTWRTPAAHACTAIGLRQKSHAMPPKITCHAVLAPGPHLLPAQSMFQPNQLGLKMTLSSCAQVQSVCSRKNCQVVSRMRLLKT